MKLRMPGRPSGRPGSWLAGAALALALAASAARPAEAGALDTAAAIGAGTFDVVLLRPLNAVALALGGGFFALSAPIVLPFEGVETAWNVFVIAPYEYVVERPIGEF